MGGGGMEITGRHFRKHYVNVLLNLLTNVDTLTL